MRDYENMPYWFQKNDGVLYAYIQGEVDMLIAGQWREAIEEELNHTYARHLVFDFSGVNFIDSSGLGVVLGRYKTVSSRGGKVMIQGVNEQVYKILVLSGFDRIMKIIPQAAMAAGDSNGILGGMNND